MTKKHLGLIFVITVFPLLGTAYADSAKTITANQDDKQFAESVIDKLKDTLMDSSMSTEDKVKQLKVVFREYFDTEYIKNRSISKIKRSSRLTKAQETELKNAIMEYLFYKYVKITSDYKNVDVSITSTRKANDMTIAYCEIISRGKEMSCKLQISNKSGARKVQKVIFEDVDLTNPDGFYRKYNDDCKKDSSELVRRLTAMSSKFLSL